MNPENKINPFQSADDSISDDLVKAIRADFRRMLWRKTETQLSEIQKLTCENDKLKSDLFTEKMKVDNLKKSLLKNFKKTKSPVYGEEVLKEFFEYQYSDGSRYHFRTHQDNSGIRSYERIFEEYSAETCPFVVGRIITRLVLKIRRCMDEILILSKENEKLKLDLENTTREFSRQLQTEVLKLKQVKIETPSQPANMKYPKIEVPA